ncbi:MAG: type II secretion system protein [Leptolyngbyaceae bacterium]|nr:type II secretion system protein [Leptolyngbyaceae bacterium]
MYRHLSTLLKLSPRKESNSTAGMTILEVLAVVIIIGILAAITAPGWLTFVNRQRANRAQDQVLQALKETQARARRTRQDQTLTFIVNEDGLPQIDYDSADPASLPPVNLGEGDLRAGMLSLRVIEDDTPLEGDTFSVRFDANGGLDVDEQNLNLPVRISVAAPADSGTQRCVILETILASTRVGRDDECNIPN